MILKNKINRTCLACWSIIVVLVMLAFSVVWAAAPFTPVEKPRETAVVRIPTEDTHKLSGIDVISRIDYGSFSIIEVPRVAVDTLKSRKALAVEDKDHGVVGLRHYRFNTKDGEPSLPIDMKINGTPGKSSLYLVQLKGPTKPEWITGIEETGARIISYIPENTYLVWADPANLPQLDKRDFIQWKGIYHPAYKISKELEKASGQIDYLAVTIVDDPEQQTLNNIMTMGATFVKKIDSETVPGMLMTTAYFSADSSLVKRIARLPKVLSLDKSLLKSGTDDAVPCQIIVGNKLGSVPFANPSYQSWLQQHTTQDGTPLDGTGSKVAVLDTGCDTLQPHPDLQSRIETVLHYPSAPNPVIDMSGHGSHVAGIIAGTGALGTVDEEGFLLGQGVAPGAKLIIQDAVVGQFPPPVTDPWERLTRDAVTAGAFVSNNSWHWDTVPGAGYTSICQEFDSLVRDANRQVAGEQPLVMVFSTANAGPNTCTIYEPKEAKNIITVGATENYRPDLPLGSLCSAANNIDGVATFSSRGPCVDGRLAPTIVAPGSHVASCVSYQAIEFGSYHDPLSPCKKLVDLDYAWMSGTSQSAPVVSGALAIIGQWWRSTHNGVNPSPAMCKAILVNTADDIAGGPDGRGGYLQHIPNADQGWGRLNLASAIDSTNKYYEDQAYVFTQTGQTRRYRVRPVDPEKPLKITLVWTDAPGMPSANAWMNDLDLLVSSTAGIYLGNMFINGWSVIGPNRDNKNNVECVYIPNPSGEYMVTVSAANIVANGVPGGAAQDQDFAIVISNAIVGGDTLEEYVTISKTSAALPDYYQSTVESGGWCAVGTRPASGSDHDIALCSDPGFGNVLGVSESRGSICDFVAIDGNRAPSELVYSKVTAFSGKAGYKVQWATKTADLVSGIAYDGNGTDSDIIRMWDISVDGPTTCAVRVQPTSGTPDLGIAIFGSTEGIVDTYYQGRHEAIALMDTGGNGQPETVSFQLPTAGRYGVLVWNKGGSASFSYSLLFDDDPPTVPDITVDSYTNDLTSLSASWTASDPDTGITKYEYAIGTTAEGTDVVNWTDTGTNTSFTRNDLTLVSGHNYYISIRAINGLGLTSQATSSAILAVENVTDIHAAKSLEDGKGVKLTSKLISAGFADRFYICEPDRSSGIGVIWSSPVTEGAEATIIGTMTTIDGERFIQATIVSP